MLNKWVKTGNYVSVTDVVLKKSGLSLDEIMTPRPVDPADIAGLASAASLINSAIIQHIPIVIVGDYDADGITSTAILGKLLTVLGATHRLIIPRRFSNGYGLSEKIIADIHNSLLITVDNGIAAIDQIAAAKKQGNTVIVLDHHLPQGILPPADIIVDPHVEPDKNAYVDYCGAGLAYKLSRYMLTEQKVPDKQRLLRDMCVLAFLGTIADVVPMTGDNRCIIKAGLRIINDNTSREQLCCGVHALLNLVGDPPYSEETVKFQLAPIINAAGRLYDAGSSSVLKALLADNMKDALIYAGKMRDINESRKKLVAEWQLKVLPSCEKQKPNRIIVAMLPGIPEGIVGIIAGKIAEQFHRPAFLFSYDEKDPNTLKGSGRTYGNFDLSDMLPRILPHCIKGGGHAGAAGITVSSDKLATITAIMNSYMISKGYVVDYSVYYDLEINEEDIPEINNELKALAPFGEGVECPVFRVKNFTCKPNRFGEAYRIMGTNKEHLRLNGSSVSGVGFSMAKKYEELNRPMNVDIVGTINENVWKGRVSLQISMSDFIPASTKEVSKP